MCLVHFSTLQVQNKLSIYHTAATVFFSQPVYTINENEGQVEPVIVLSNPSSIDVTVRIRERRGTATG